MQLTVLLKTETKLLRKSFCKKCQNFTPPIISKPQMLHRQPAVDELFQRINPDVQMLVEKRLRHFRVARRRLHAVRRHRLVADEQQRARRDFIVEARDENRRRLHVNPDAADGAEIFFELVVMFPHAAVRRINRAGPVIALVIADRR